MGKFITLNVHIRISQIKKFSFHLKILKKANKTQNKQKEIIKPNTPHEHSCKNNKQNFNK